MLFVLNIGESGHTYRCTDRFGCGSESIFIRIGSSENVYITSVWYEFCVCVCVVYNDGAKYTRMQHFCYLIELHCRNLNFSQFFWCIIMGLQVEFNINKKFFVCRLSINVWSIAICLFLALVVRDCNVYIYICRVCMSHCQFPFSFC